MNNRIKVIAVLKMVMAVLKMVMVVLLTLGLIFTLIITELNLRPPAEDESATEPDQIVQPAVKSETIQSSEQNKLSEPAECASEIEVLSDVQSTEEVETVHSEIEYDTYINQEYVEYAKEAAEIYELSPALIISIIEAESRGQADISNSSGTCHGLMQIYIHYHWDRLNRFLPDDQTPSLEDIYSPRLNILVGTDYISELIDKNEGNVAVALMEYNGDSKANQEGYLSKYAESILNRTEELEDNDN